MKPKFNTYENAIEYLRTNKTIPKELRFLMMNSMRSIFLTFFDKIFERTSDITIPSLGNKERIEDVEKQNDEYMIKKAMMKDTDFEDIKKSEIQYLQSKYGNVIPDLTSFLNKSVLNVIHLRHKVIMLLHKSLRDPKLRLIPFLKTLMLIEADVNKYLIPEGSLFKFSFLNRVEKVHFFFKMDQIQDSSLGKYEVIAFESSFLDNLSKIMNEDGKCYFGFDALYSETEEYRIKLNNLRTQLGELGVPYGSSIILKNVENSMWSSMSTKVQRDEKSKSEGRDEDEMSGFIEEPPEKSSNSESNEEEVFETVNEVSLLTFFHFCEKPTPESSKGNLVRRIKDMLLFRRRNSSKNDISGENDQKLKKGKILVIEEKEKQRKMNLINMPDLEFAFLLQDLSEIIMLYNKQFFSMIDQIIITAAQQGSPKPSLRPDNLVRKSEPKVPSSRKHHPLNPEEN